MRENSRTGSWGAGKERFDLSLDRKQAIAVVVGAVAVVGVAFAIGMSAGSRVAARAQPAPPASDLARLDEPLPVAPSEEPPPALAAHDALVSARPMDKTLPTPAVKPAPRDAAASAMTPTVTPSAPPAVAAAAPAEASAAPPAVAGPPEPPPVADALRPAGRPHAAPTPPRSAISRRDRETKGAHASARPHAGRYAIQIGAASKRADAERLAKRAGSRGARIVEAKIAGKGHVYRVQVGTYDSREAASRQLAALSRSGLTGFVVASR